MSSTQQDPHRVARKTAITNVKVFDGHQLSEPCTVVIDGELIGSDPKGARMVDGSGMTLLPGLIDAHVHVRTRHQLDLLARAGVTTALDMGGWPPDLMHSLRGQVGLTDIRTAGIPATAAGSIHARFLGLPLVAMVESPEEASRFVADRISEGSDYIKLIADIPGPTQPTLNSLAAAAHQQGKLSIAHAATYGPFAMAQEAKVDVVTHSPQDKPLTAADAALMASEARIAIPTLTMTEAIARSGIMPPEGNSHARKSVKAMYSHGVPILAGTDTHAERKSPALVWHGESMHRELELLVIAGLSTVDALRAATSLPAEHFGLKDRGVVEPGFRADLVLVAGNPVADIKATRSIRRVWCGGVEVELGYASPLHRLVAFLWRLEAEVRVGIIRSIITLLRVFGVKLR